MKALLQLLPIRDGHFLWCADRSAAAGCNRCRARFYLFAILVSGTTALLEFWGHSETRSDSLLADAFHVLSDSLGYFVGWGLSLVLLYGWYKKKHTEMRQAALTAVAALTLMVALYMFFQSALNLAFGALPGLRGGATLWTISSIGLIANLVLLLCMWLLKVEHSHIGEEHQHSDEHHHEDTLLGLNFLHTAGDSLSSLGPLVTGVLLDWTENPQVGYLDQMVAMAISLWLFYQVRKILIQP